MLSLPVHASPSIMQVPTAQVKSVLPILLEEEESRVRIAAGEGRDLITMGTRGFSRPVGVGSG